MRKEMTEGLNDGLAGGMTTTKSTWGWLWPNWPA